MARKKKLLLGTIGGAIVAVGTAFQLTRVYYEEPAYEKLETIGDLEIRRYEGRVVAQTRVRGSEREATREGFRRLAGYIFGGNDGGRSVAMTTPVEREPERIAMTTPVEREADDEGWRVTFTMPSEHAIGALPTPDDDSVQLRELPAETVAVLRFRGRATPEVERARQAELLRRVRESGYEAIGEPRLAQYDPPWVLGPFRRNEVMIPVRPTS